MQLESELDKWRRQREEPPLQPRVGWRQLLHGHIRGRETQPRLQGGPCPLGVWGVPPPLAQSGTKPCVTGQVTWCIPISGERMWRKRQERSSPTAQATLGPKDPKQLGTTSSALSTRIRGCRVPPSGELTTQGRLTQGHGNGAEVWPVVLCLIRKERFDVWGGGYPINTAPSRRENRVLW